MTRIKTVDPEEAKGLRNSRTDLIRESGAEAEIRDRLDRWRRQREERGA